MHAAVHIAILGAFLVAAGLAVLGAAAPLLFPKHRPTRLLNPRTSGALGLGALMLLVTDWLLHRFL